MLSSSYMRPPLANFVLYCLALFAVPLTFAAHSYWLLPVTLLCMIHIHHGTHEAVHGTLYPGAGRHRVANLFAGALGFANFGHNFILLRWSHMVHHRYGRLQRIYTTEEGVETKGVPGQIIYYTLLMGLPCFSHEVAGYLYPLIGTKGHLISRDFHARYYRNASYTAIQIYIAFYTALLIYEAPLYFLISRTLFTAYWGMFQNVAHYGLEFEQPTSRLASRTYRVGRIYETLIFRSGTYHLEHHVLPQVPGPCLGLPEVQAEVTARLGFRAPAKHGLLTYWRDCIEQFRGPSPEHSDPIAWRPGDADTMIVSGARMQA